MGAKKLVFLDIDGTLTVPGSHTPPKSALDAIRQARENGHQVWICTGRSLPMTRPVLRWPFDGAVVSAGGLILRGEETLYDQPMEPEELVHVRRTMEDESLFLVLEALNDTFGDLRLERILSNPEYQSGEANSELARWIAMLREDFSVRDIREYDGSPVYKVSFLSVRREPVERARRELEKRYAFVMHGFFQNVLNGELIPRLFDKGKAVLRVCDALGIPREDSIGFGDSPNDLPMLEAAGVGVCMGNGSEIVQRRADRVCPSVEEDGLARAFAELGLT